MFILNEEGNHSRIFLSRGISTAFFCMFTGMKIVSSIFAYSYFLFLQLFCCLQYDKINLSLPSHFQRRGGTGFKSPNVSRENPLEPRLQNSIWHTNCVYVSARIIFFWSYLTFENWEFGMALLKFTSIFTIQFHDLDLSMHAYYHSRQNFTSRTTYKR